MIAESLTRPYPVSLPMLVLVSLVPLYLVIADFAHGRTLHAPALSWDHAVTVQPAWAFVYGSLYAFLIALPFFVVRQEDHIRRTVYAYLMVWITSYVCFLIYPTVAPRPAEVAGGGYLVWGVRFLYGADPPYNCFPSIHVAHSFVSAFAVSRTHRELGIAAGICAVLVAVSTVFTRQHYILDVIAGAALAWVAYVIFLRQLRREDVPPLDRRLAPVFALGTIGLVGLGVACSWVAYRLNVVP